MSVIDSQSMGDPRCFQSLQALDFAISQGISSPATNGILTRIVIRAEGGRRILRDEGELCCDRGLVGDQWGLDEGRIPDAQIAVMEESVARLICHGQPPELSGDNLWLDLDLAESNLPEGSVLRIGDAELLVTRLPHDGCLKFRGRFGDDALRFVSRPETRSRNLRGVYLRVTRPGMVRIGQSVTVISRPE